MSGAGREPLRGVQVLRGLAATMVVVLHVFLFTAGENGPGFPAGAAGVDIFFAISGAVMALSAPALTPGDFLTRRIARIVPLWWLFLALKLMQMALAGGSARLGMPSVTYVLASFVFVPTYDPSGQALPLILVGWTLNYEMAFYGICTLALLLSPRRFTLVATAIIVGAALAGFCLRAAVGSPRPAAAVLLSPLLLEFVGGMIAARLWSRGLGQPAFVSATLIAAAVILLAVGPDQQIYAPMRPLIWGVPALMILWSVLALERQVPFGRMGTLLLIGDASYAIYLAHTAAIPIAGRALRFFLPGSTPMSLTVTLLTAIAIAAGVAVHLLIEKPLVRRLARTLRTRPPRIGGDKL